MKLTESQLRNIIREEIKKTISSLEEIFVPDPGQRVGFGVNLATGLPNRKPNSKPSAPPERATGPEPDSLRDSRMKIDSIRKLSNDLSEIDKDYVKSIIPASSIESYASWVGPELKEKLYELSLRYYKSYGKLTAQDAFNEFKALVEKYSPTRAKKGVVGSLTRGLSSFGLGTTTKE